MITLQLRGSVGPGASALSVWDGQEKTFDIVIDPNIGGAALFHGDRCVAHLSNGDGASWDLWQDDVLRARMSASHVTPPVKRDRNTSPLQWLLAPPQPGPSRPTPRTYAVCDLVSGGGRYLVQQNCGEWGMAILDPAAKPAGRFQMTPSGFSLQMEDGQDRFLLLGIVLYLLKRVQDAAAPPARPVIAYANPPYPDPAWPPALVARPSRRQKWIDDPVEDRWRRDVAGSEPGIGQDATIGASKTGYSESDPS